MVLAGGTAFKMVPFGFSGGLLLLLPTGALLLLIHLFCFSDICLFSIRFADAAIADRDKSGFGSGVSAPLLLKIERLRLAPAAASYGKCSLSCSKAPPLRDADCASMARTLVVGVVVCCNSLI